MITHWRLGTEDRRSEAGGLSRVISPPTFVPLSPRTAAASNCFSVPQLLGYTPIYTYIYIWLCLVKQITTTNKLHSNQSWSMPTKGSRLTASHVRAKWEKQPKRYSKRGKKPVKYRKLLFKFTATTTGSDSRESIRK